LLEASAFRCVYSEGVRRALFVGLGLGGAFAWACGSSDLDLGGNGPSGPAPDGGGGADAAVVVSACGPTTLHVDRSFGTSGVVTRRSGNYVYPPTLRISSGGLLRFLQGPQGTVLERLRADGSADPGFDTMAFHTIDAAPNAEPLDAIVLHDGGIALAYVGQPAGTAVVARLRPDGTVDTAFGANGLARVAVPVGDAGLTSRPEHLAEGADGAIYAIGTVTVTYEYLPAEVFLARFTPTGALDTAYGVGGVNLLTRPYYNIPFGMVALSDARLLVAIYSQDQPGNAATVAFSELWRFTPSGQVDPTFGPPDAGVPLPRYGPHGVMLPLRDDAVLLGDFNGHVQKRTVDGNIDPAFADGGEVPFSRYLDDAGKDWLTVGLPLAVFPSGGFATIAVRDYTHALMIFDPNGIQCGPLYPLPFAADVYDDRSALVIAPDGSIYVERDPDDTEDSELTRFVL
jgi:uncharacterized delta-60 repeat protein